MKNSTTTSAHKARPKKSVTGLSTRDNILYAAVNVFAKYGLVGGSVDKISKAAKSHDRMIYYYFGNKEGLFVAVLEEIYRRFNEAETSLQTIPGDPVASLRKVVHFIIHYFRDHPEFVTILNSENLQRGKHVSQSTKARQYSITAVGVIGTVLAQGREAGLFRDEVSARDIYMLISSLGYFYQSNRFTLSAYLGEKLESDETFAQWETFAIDSVLRTVLKDPTQACHFTPAASHPQVSNPTLPS